MSAPPSEALLAGAGQLGVKLDPAQAAAMLRLLDELEHWNRRYSLTAIQGREQMIALHLLDSLSALPVLAGPRVADVGTGPGFPGLPLAIAAPERHFTLIDSVGKKCRFAAHAARLLGLTNVTIVQARAESLASGSERVPAPFDTILARAFATLAEFISVTDRIAGPATRLVALKGRLPTEELAALPNGWRAERVEPVSIAGLAAQRHLVVLARIAPNAVPDPGSAPARETR